MFDLQKVRFTKSSIYKKFDLQKVRVTKSSNHRDSSCRIFIVRRSSRDRKILLKSTKVPIQQFSYSVFIPSFLGSKPLTKSKEKDDITEIQFEEGKLIIKDGRDPTGWKLLVHFYIQSNL